MLNHLNQFHKLRCSIKKKFDFFNILNLIDQMKKILLWSLACLCMLAACQQKQTDTPDSNPDVKQSDRSTYIQYDLTTDMSQLSDAEKKMIPLLIEAADIMDELFWKESYGDKAELMSKITNEADKKYAMINYGPWAVRAVPACMIY